MSLNTLLEQRHLHEVEALRVLLSNFLGSWKNAQTQQERLAVEVEALDLYKRLNRLASQVTTVKPGQHPEKGEIELVVTNQEYLITCSSAKLRKLAEQYLAYFNNQRIQLLELTGTLRRIKQKSSALALWDDEQAKFVLQDSFLNYDGISMEKVSVPECTVDTVQGVLTLPIHAIQTLIPTKVTIGSGSNGNPGNSDEEVQTNNNKPEFMLNESPSDWFEYERLDSGPLNLSLVCEFDQEQILNSIAIEPINPGISMSFEILDIVYNSSQQASLSIKDLINPDLSDGFWVVKPVGNDTFWRANHLPIRAKSVVIRLRQSSSYPVAVVSPDGTLASRQRYAVGIKNLLLQRKEYDSIGGTGSKQQGIPSGLYAAVPVVSVFPAEPTLYGLDLQASHDGGEQWSENLWADATPHTNLMGGEETSFQWRLLGERYDNAFSQLTSWTNTKTTYEVSSILRSVSRFQSPAQLSLPERPANQKVYCIQPRVLRRGDRVRGILLGEGGQLNCSFKLPFQILDGGLDPASLIVLVNSHEWSYADSNEELAFGNWTYSEDFSEILFSNQLPAGAKVKVLLDSEIGDLEERSDGYYHQMGLVFDPDKHNIDLAFVERNPTRQSMVVPKGQRAVSLRAKNIHQGSVLLVSKLGLTYTETFSKSELGSETGTAYFVDHINGVLYLATALNEDTVKITFSHQPIKSVPRASFSVVYDGPKPWGVKINKSSLEGIEATERIGNALVPRVDPLTGIYEARLDRFPGNQEARTLSHYPIVRGSLRVSSDLLDLTSVKPEELDFIDGTTEFLGLKPMDEEETIETFATTDIVSFKLSAGAAWYAPLGIEFDDAGTFGTKQTSVGAVNSSSEYYIDPDGTVWVWIGTGNAMPGGIKIQYMYRDTKLDRTNKYSVDYRAGLLYTTGPMRNNAVVTYKTIALRVQYDVAQEIDQYSYDASTNSVQIRTEGLQETNSLVKIIWSKQTDERTIEDLKRYFSPMISMVGFRFN